MSDLDKPPFLWQAKQRYGEIIQKESGWIWPNEAAWCTVMPISDHLGIDWVNTATQKPTTRIYCNKDMAPYLKKALSLVRQRKLLPHLKTFDGCFEPRSIRGRPGIVSTHSYGLAIDINAASNPLGGPGDIDPELVECFTEAGFLHGGNFRRKDSMHFQWAMW